MLWLRRPCPSTNVRFGNPIADGQTVPFNPLDLHIPCWRNNHLTKLTRLSLLFGATGSFNRCAPFGDVRPPDQPLFNTSMTQKSGDNRLCAPHNATSANGDYVHFWTIPLSLVYMSCWARLTPSLAGHVITPGDLVGTVPRGFMKWIPKGCEVPNEKKKSIGPTFVKGLNLVAWTHVCAGNLKKCEGLCQLIKFLEEKRPTLKLNQCSVQRPSTVKWGFLITKHITHWKNNIKDKTFLISIFNSCFKFIFMIKYLL